MTSDDPSRTATAISETCPRFASTFSTYEFGNVSYGWEPDGGSLLAQPNALEIRKHFMMRTPDEGSLLAQPATLKTQKPLTRRETKLNETKQKHLKLRQSAGTPALVHEQTSLDSGLQGKCR